MMAHEPFETAQSQGTPTVRQQSVFIDDRVGQLLRLTRFFDDTEIRILALSQLFAHDCGICRMLLDDPDTAHEVLTRAGFQVSESELIVVSLPHGKRGLLHTWVALLRGEVNIHYTYPLLIRPRQSAAIAVCTDSIDQAADVLRDSKFELLDQHDLFEARFE